MAHYQRNDLTNYEPHVKYFASGTERGGEAMKKKLIAAVAVALLALAAVTPALADAPPPGPLTGNEGQPGHHGGPQHNP